MTEAIRSKSHRPPTGIIIVAMLMILFGIAEVATGFTHHFFGISTSESVTFTVAGVAIGLFYVAAGRLILTMRKWAAALAILLLCADIVGRIALVAAGLYPVDTLLQTFAIVIGTAIAAVFAIYIGLKWKLFR